MRGEDAAPPGRLHPGLRPAAPPAGVRAGAGCIPACGLGGDGLDRDSGLGVLRPRLRAGAGAGCARTGPGAGAGGSPGTGRGESAVSSLSGGVRFRGPRVRGRFRGGGGEPRISESDGRARSGLRGGGWGRTDTTHGTVAPRAGRQLRCFKMAEKGVPGHAFPGSSSGEPPSPPAACRSPGCLREQ